MINIKISVHITEPSSPLRLTTVPALMRFPPVLAHSRRLGPDHLLSKHVCEKDVNCIPYISASGVCHQMAEAVATACQTTVVLMVRPGTVYHGVWCSLLVGGEQGRKSRGKLNEKCGESHGSHALAPRKNKKPCLPPRKKKKKHAY